MMEQQLADLVGKVRIVRQNELIELVSLAATTFPLACPTGAKKDDITHFIQQNLSLEKFSEYVQEPNTGVLVCPSNAIPVEDQNIILLGYMLIFASAQLPPIQNIAQTFPGNTPAYLSKCYVRKEFHGSPAASKLLTQGKIWAKEHGCDSIWLNTNQANLRAARFYEKNGFNNIGVRSFTLGNQVYDDFVFACELD